MTKEEFLDKTAVANKTINSLTGMIEKIKQTKMEGVQLFIEMNKRFEPNQRVRVYKNSDSKSHDKKEFVGFGYVKYILVDEDYGVIFYSIKKEDKISKQETDECFDFSDCGVHMNDFEYCMMLIDRV